MHLSGIDLVLGIFFVVGFLAVVDLLWDKEFMDE